MPQDTPSSLKQNELFIEYDHFQRLVEMDVDAKRDHFKLIFDNERLWTESSGHVVIKCRFPGKDANVTLEYDKIDASMLSQLIRLSMQQQRMRISTDNYKGIPDWLEKSLQRISDLRLGRDMLDVLGSQRQDSSVEMEVASSKFDLRVYINEALQKEVNELTRHLRVQPDGIGHIRALLNIGGLQSNAPMIRYGLNAVNDWTVPHLQDSLKEIADELSLPKDVRCTAASFL